MKLAVSRVRERPEEKDRYIDMDLQYRLYNEYTRICFENNGILLSTDCDIQTTYESVRTKVKEILEES